MEQTFGLCADCGGSTNWVALVVACVAATVFFVAARRIGRRGGAAAISVSVTLYLCAAASILFAFVV